MFRRVGQAIGLVREERGLSQVELARLCRIGQLQISKYEAGKEQLPQAAHRWRAELDRLGASIRIRQIVLLRWGGRPSAAAPWSFYGFE